MRAQRNTGRSTHPKTCAHRFHGDLLLEVKVLRQLCGFQSGVGQYGRVAYLAERAVCTHTPATRLYQLMLARVLCANGKEMGTTTAGSLVKSPPGDSIHTYIILCRASSRRHVVPYTV